MTNPAVIAELKRIADARGGELLAVDVVDAARPENSVLHGQFDWDDSEAAEKWRLHQARNLIRVTVEYVGPKERQVPARVFVSLTPDRRGDGGKYRLLASVMSNREYRKQLIADAKDDMEHFKKKYAELRELESVFRAMREVSLDEDRMPWLEDYSSGVTVEDAVRLRA